MFRIEREWAPYVDKDGDPARDLPLFISLGVVERGVRKTVSARPQAATSYQLERALEYHRQRAVQGLRRYARGRSRRTAKNTAEHMMLANLACQFFNLCFGQDPLKDVPFPIVG